MPSIVIQLIAGVVGEIFRQIITNLPALEEGLREISTSMAMDAVANPLLTAALSAELDAAIAKGVVPA